METIFYSFNFSVDVPAGLTPAQEREYGRRKLLTLISTSTDEEIELSLEEFERFDTDEE